MSDHNLTSLDILSKHQAAGDYLCIPDNVDWLDAYDAAIEGNEALEQKEISIWEPYDGSTQEWVTENIDNHRWSINERLKEYGKYIKSGIAVLTIDGSIDSDVNNWDMDMLATIGMNIGELKTIDGDAVKFYFAICEWVSEKDVRYDFSRETGLPIVD